VAQTETKEGGWEGGRERERERNYFASDAYSSPPFALSLSLEQFGEAFEVVPRTLAENSGQDATAIMSSLYEQHLDGKAPNVGVDISGGKTYDAAAAEVVDVLSTKESAIRLAVDAAITVLRVDQIIMSKKAGGGKGV
jgi:T-complex protein 1 subunit theta